MSELPVQSEPISEADRLRQEITDLINSGIVEVAARNPNVLEYMRHWEGRAETAEAALAASDARIAELEAEVERLRAGPKVRLLEWRNAPRAMADMQCEGIAAVGNNYVLTKLWHEQRGAEWCCLGYMYPTLEAAKAAAQADYEARILSALEAAMRGS